MRDALRRTFRVLAICLSLGLGGPAVAEHPTEHPKEAPKAAAAEQPRVSMEQLAAAITKHCEEETAAKGSFQVEDSVQGKTLSLKLDKIHHDKLARIHEGTYFACADFKTEDGTVYDLDIFMQGDGPETLKTTEVIVHKKDGKPRYNWKEENGSWVKVPVE